MYMHVGSQGDPLPVAQLKQGLQQIVSDTCSAPTHAVGYLTTMNRLFLSYSLLW